MKAAQFKIFKELVEKANSASSIWYMGYYWIDLTHKQLSEISKVLDTKDCIRTGHNSHTGESYHILPNGLQIRKV